MKIESQYNQLVNKPTLSSTLSNSNQSFGLELMCCRVGIVQEFFPNDLTADVLIVNKITTGLNQDGSQVVKDWAKIRAKVCYCSPFETFPIKQGDECLLVFSDREIESWFINGTSSPIAHSRMHDETDCIAIFGLRSLPKMIQILTDALHLFYGNSDIQLKNDSIISNTSNFKVNADAETDITTKKYNLNASDSIKAETETLTVNATNTQITSALAITGNTIQTGDITATNLGATAAASGTFTTADSKTVTVLNGIITAIE